MPYLGPAIVTVIALAGVFVWGGVEALVLAAALAVLEVTFSFDNAVVNAKVLAKMPALWRRRFLTWGMLVSVAGVRLVLPVLIVSALAVVSPFAITAIAFADPARYAELVAAAGPAIKAFGGAFLLLVALNYFFDPGKSVHWLPRVERRMVRLGEIESIEVAIALIVTAALAIMYGADGLPVLASGVAGVVLFILSKGLGDALSAETSYTQTGAALFAYVSVLDAALSLDGVVGAFAITTAIPIIVVGLGIGAYFVRTFTIAMVRGRTLERFIYLEHGAHWAIFGLAACMLAGLAVPVPEWVTATVGLVFIALAYGSSRREEVRLTLEP